LSHDKIVKWNRKGKLLASTVRSQFDRRYPNHFKGIISSNEYSQSIDKSIKISLQIIE